MKLKTKDFYINEIAPIKDQLNNVSRPQFLLVSY